MFFTSLVLVGRVEFPASTYFVSCCRFQTRSNANFKSAKLLQMEPPGRWFQSACQARKRREAEAQPESEEIPYLRNVNKGSRVPFVPFQAKEAEAKEKERRKEEAAKASAKEIRKCLIWIYQEACTRGLLIVVHFGNGIGKPFYSSSC